MNQPSREQIEARITALLLGELPDDEAQLLRYTISQDAALKKLHDERASTIVLVREAEKNPADAPAEKIAALKLSAERRKKLLAHFQTPRKPDPLFWLKPIKIPALIQVLAVVALLALVAAMFLPALASAKKKARHLTVLSAAERGTYGDQKDVLAAKENLETRTWSGDNADRYPASASVPASTVTLAPEPKLASPPAQIFLPQTESSTIAGVVNSSSGISGSGQIAGAASTRFGGVGGGGQDGALGPDGDNVPFDVQVDRARVDAGQVELDVENDPVPPGVHRHHRRASEGAVGAEDLLGESVQFTERVGAHQHRVHLHRVIS